MRMSRNLVRILFPLFLLGLLTACDNSAAPDSITHVIPDAGSTGGKLLKEFCSACHGAPRPASHKADEWQNIVLRMQNHRIKKAYKPLSETEMQDLVSYLQKHSAL